MRSLQLLALSLALALTGVAKSSHSSSHSSGSTVHVKTYTKKNGTVVQKHDRTAPDKTKKNNWSTKGNVNPETGKAGTKPADK